MPQVPSQGKSTGEDRENKRFLSTTSSAIGHINTKLYLFFQTDGMPSGQIPMASSIFGEWEISPKAEIQFDPAVSASYYRIGSFFLGRRSGLVDLDLYAGYSAVVEVDAGANPRNFLFGRELRGGGAPSASITKRKPRCIFTNTPFGSASSGPGGMP